MPDKFINDQKFRTLKFSPEERLAVPILRVNGLNTSRSAMKSTSLPILVFLSLSVLELHDGDTNPLRRIYYVVGVDKNVGDGKGYSSWVRQNTQASGPCGPDR